MTSRYENLDFELLQERREFLKLMGSTLGLAGLAGCVKQPAEQIYPYVRAPEHLIPGRPRHYATALSRDGIGRGVLVESHDGRPTKIEGNELHPATLGGTDVWMQADILSLYDPDRSQMILRRGRPSTWARFLEEVPPSFVPVNEGAGLALLTGNVTSPTLAAQIASLQRALPELRWFQWESVHGDERRRATELSYGRPLDVIYDFSEADVVVCLDGDPLFAEAGSVRYAKDAMARRRDPARLARWYVVESTPTCTGSIADHRIRAKRSEIGVWVRALAGRLGVRDGGEGYGGDAVAAMARDLERAKGRGLLVVGPHQPPEVQALAFEINERIGARGKTFFTIPPVAASPVRHTDELRSLVTAIEANEVSTLVVFGTNPIFDAPADVDFASAYMKVPQRVHVGLYDDETAYVSHWHLPARHELEEWSDTRSFEGTVSIVQPLVHPIYGGQSVHTLLAVLAGEDTTRPHDIVRATWQKAWGASLEDRWKRVLHDGFIPDTRSEPVSIAPRRVDLPATPPFELEITFGADPTLWDGHYANNAWLQELPKPFTKLSWDNAAVVGPETAKQLGVQMDDVVELVVGERKTTAAIFVLVGQAEGSIWLSLGGGRRRGGRLAPKTGFDASPIRTTERAWFAPLDVRTTGRRFQLVTTQHHHEMEGRHLVREATLAQFVKNPSFAQAPEARVAKLSLYPEPDPTIDAGPVRSADQWGMAINLNTCIGCNACVVACQSENNVPVVGKDQVAMGREMHWLRVDNYFEVTEREGAGAVRLHNQPVTCMHCENAPCEVVCPVNATVHSPSGVNEMVYNRCVGTRYCSNNCPYKVRRFNFYLYQDWDTPSYDAMRNPDVSVRSRGVMEKCTYCIQRIQEARIRAKKDDREVQDGEVVTACQSACPTQAITFGDVADADSKVSREKASPLDYTLIEELNVRPRTSYTAKLRNVSPSLVERIERLDAEGDE